MSDEYDELDDDEYEDCSDAFDEYEDERRAARGTSECDGLCDPRCDWCLVAHDCPDDCLGGPCPYESLDPQLAEMRAYNLGQRDAMDGTKRKRLGLSVKRAAYLAGYESWIRRKDDRRGRKKMARREMALGDDIGF